MSRRISTKKRFPQRDSKYDNLLVSLLINRILQKGKKRLARRIVYKAFELIEFRTNQNPILIFEKAIRNSSPRVQLKAKRIGGATYQVPTEVRHDRAQALAIRWLIIASRKRSEKTMEERLSAEFMDASNNRGAAVKKREDTHKMAEANRAFAHYRW